MGFTYYITLFIAIVSCAIYLTNLVNTWVSILAIKENFVDKYWATRFIYLLISAGSIVYLISQS
jgi:hypothetical protein